MAKLKLPILELKDICFSLKAIPECQALGFETDCQIDDLAEKGIKLYSYEQKRFRNTAQKRVEEIRKENPGLSVEALDAIIVEDPELIRLTSEANEYWESEVELDYKPIEIPMQDYSKLFPKQHVQVSVLDQVASKSPYQALIDLRRKKIIVITKTEN